jgi:ribosomal protein RSM22 (predicted rRNA methylase)
VTLTPSRLPAGALIPASRATPSERIADASLALRRSIDRNVHPSEGLAAGAAALSGAYRAEGASALGDARSAEAYAAIRMPATFAAAARALAAAAERLPGFSPASLLDLGAGPGATSWAATVVWPTVGTVVAVEGRRSALDLGRRLAEDRDWTWRLGDVAASRLDAADVVAAGYLLGELDEDARARLVDRAWAATRGILVLVEPGSRAGFGRILEARDRLIAGGARIVAPCPVEAACPIAISTTTWCHFLARLDRSPLHRSTKRAARSWEDEPFSYVVAARPSVVADPRPRVVLGRPRHRPGVVELRVCLDGRIETVVRSRRDGPAYRAARDHQWGDAVDPVVLEPG